MNQKVVLLVAFSILIIGIILSFWLSRKEKYGNFDKLREMIPREALNCPYMKSAGIDLGDRKYMKEHWKTVRNAVESGYMPPESHKDIWTEEEKQKFLKKLTEWGEKQA